MGQMRSYDTISWRENKLGDSNLLVANKPNIYNIQGRLLTQKL